MHRARKVQAGEDKTAFNGILDIPSVCYMRHVVQSHVLWSVDYEKSEYGVQDAGNFQKLVSTRVVEEF